MFPPLTIDHRDLSTVLVEKERYLPDLANNDRQLARRNAMSNTHRAAAPETPQADDELLTLQEVAVLVRVPVATLRYWRHLGTGPHSFRIGRGIRYWRTEVFAWLHDQANADRQSVV
jgi:predicted DNA-binding transcriptional regulator AlpA